MVIPQGFDHDVYRRFWKDKEFIMQECGNKGDQMAIEILYPDAVYLQDVMPDGYFMGYRDFTDEKPDAAIAIFAGKNKPDNSRHQWAKEAWQ